MSLCDPADGPDEEFVPDCLLDGLSEVCLVRGRRRGVTDFDALQRVISAGGDVEEVNAVLGEDRCKFDRIGYCPGGLIR